MADDSHKEEPIIIKRRKKHGAHPAHGGSWKVAYADFVTAMMALFIVLWILGQSQPMKEAIEHYFSHTEQYNIFTGKRGDVFLDLGMHPSKLGEGKGVQKGAGQGEDRAEIKGEDEEKHEFTFFVDFKDSVVGKKSAETKKDSIRAAQEVGKTGDAIEEFVKQLKIETPELSELLKSITIELTKEGLKIELIETSENVFFKIGNDELTKGAKVILKALSKEIGKLPNPVEIEGHTDSRQYGKGALYTNWELSVDRANSTRRYLQVNGFWEGQVSQVTGFADRKLKTPDNPLDTRNRRISILVRQLKQSDFSSGSAAN